MPPVRFSKKEPLNTVIRKLRQGWLRDISGNCPNHSLKPPPQNRIYIASLESLEEIPVVLDITFAVSLILLCVFPLKHRA